MPDRAVIAIIAALCLGGLPAAQAHSLFNSAEEFVGGYRVQIATLPEFPQIGEESRLLLRITDADYEEVESFEAGIRIYYNGQQIKGWPPASVEGSHWESAFVFETQGNHLVKVDLHGLRDDGRPLSYTFNISTQSPFGYIFIFSITAGAVMFAVIMGIVYVPRRMPGFRRRP